MAFSLSIRKFRDGKFYVGTYNPFLGSWQKLDIHGYATKKEAQDAAAASGRHSGQTQEH